MAKFVNEKRQKKIEEYYKNKILDTYLIIDNVWDPHNVSAIARTADGFGIEKIYLYYTYNKFPDVKQTGKKSSSSANKWIKFERINDLKSFAEEKKKEGFRFIGTVSNTNSKRIDTYRFEEKSFFILGSESEGLSKEALKICDELVYIPMVGMVESYNVSVSAAIFMYELFKQKGILLKLRESSA